MIIRSPNEPADTANWYHNNVSLSSILEAYKSNNNALFTLKRIKYKQIQCTCSIQLHVIMLKITFINVYMIIMYMYYMYLNICWHSSWYIVSVLCYTGKILINKELDLLQDTSFILQSYTVKVDTRVKHLQLWPLESRECHNTMTLPHRDDLLAAAWQLHDRALTQQPPNNA